MLGLTGRLVVNLKWVLAGFTIDIVGANTSVVSPLLADETEVWHWRLTGKGGADLPRVLRVQAKPAFPANNRVILVGHTWTLIS